MSTEIKRADPTELEYVPFMAKEPIKLSLNIVRTYLSKPTKSGKECPQADAIRFMMLCRARGLNPFEGDAFLVGYDGKDGPEFSLITSHQAFLKRAETHNEYDGMESGVIVKNSAGEVVDREGDFTYEGDVVLGGWATVFFKTRSHPMKKRLKLSAYSKGNKFWNDNPAGMICKCAEADALRSSFPTLLGGMYLDDELKNVTLPADFRVPAVASNPPLLPVDPPQGTKSQRTAQKLRSNRTGEPAEMFGDGDPQEPQQNQAERCKAFLAACKTQAEVQDVYDRFTGPDSPCSDAERKECRDLCMARGDELTQED